VILLDTHMLVWMVADSKRLSRAAAVAIRTAQREDGLAISAISPWELAALVTRGRIQAYGTVETSVRLLIEGVTIQPIELSALPHGQKGFALLRVMRTSERALFLEQSGKNRRAFRITTVCIHGHPAHIPVVFRLRETI
jgi:hypothetical protein